MSLVQAAANNVANEQKVQVNEIENTSRIIANIMALLNDVEVKGAYAKPVYEAQSFLENFHRGLQDQIKRMKPEPTTTSLDVVGASETPAAKVNG